MKETDVICVQTERERQVLKWLTKQCKCKFLCTHGRADESMRGKKRRQARRVSSEMTDAGPRQGCWEKNLCFSFLTRVNPLWSFIL